ncbi:olfactory receptor 14A16-like [Melanerpes formicivorus]|uniref:olfactory receptor 14A16-like n=1 Tax=Melanerpes formicivorus TaxID=211600 RepID=UPI00358F5AB9
MPNSSSITHFLLLPFPGTRQLQLLHFCLFLAIYLAALLGNGLIITTIAWDHHLHTPMYFFLLNLALTDLGCISTTVPMSMANSLRDTRDISYAGCAAQLFMFFFFISAEYFLLTTMSYDRYVAICRPLHYETLLGSRVCVCLTAAAWACGSLNALLHTANTFSLPLCQGNAVEQFFCEIPQILKLSCSTSYLRELWLLVASAYLFFVCFVFIVVSYVQIFRAVLRIPSQQGRHKAFATCLPHLAVVSLFLGPGTFAYLKPSSISSPSLDLVVSVLYSVVPPAVNPLIYSLRNQELKAALSKLIPGCCGSGRGRDPVPVAGFPGRPRNGRGHRPGDVHRSGCQLTSSPHPLRLRCRFSPHPLHCLPPPPANESADPYCPQSPRRWDPVRVRSPPG